MTGYRVFLRGEPSTEPVLAALELVHPLLALDGPIGPADLVGVRGSLLIELREDHEETDHAGLARYPLLVLCPSPLALGETRSSPLARTRTLEKQL